MNDFHTAALVRPQSPASEISPHSDMVWISGGTFRMGSDRHYAEEAPVHRVSVSGFWMDRTPVTNRDFRKFVNATGYVTFAETRPDAKDYPGALPHMLKAGSLVFTPPKCPVDLRGWSQCRSFSSASSPVSPWDTIRQPPSTRTSAAPSWIPILSTCRDC